MMDFSSPYGIPPTNVNVNLQNPMFLPRTTVRQCDGEQGARGMQMGPNSQEIFMDTTGPLVWLVATDEHANKTMVNGFRIEPYIPEPEPDMKTLMARLDRLEEMITNGKPDAGAASRQGNNSPKRSDSKWNEPDRSGVQKP